jgi:hypothetical protein
MRDIKFLPEYSIERFCNAFSITFIVGLETRFNSILQLNILYIQKYGYVRRFRRKLVTKYQPTTPYTPH